MIDISYGKDYGDATREYIIKYEECYGEDCPFYYKAGKEDKCRRAVKEGKG